MPIASQWLIAPHIHINRFTGDITLQDFEQMNAANIVEIEQNGTDAGVFVIISLAPDVQYSPDFMNVRTIRQVSSSPRKMKALIVIDANHSLAAKFVGTTVLRLVKIKYHTCRTEAEALAWVQSQRPELKLSQIV